MEEEIIDLLDEFGKKHNLEGEEGYYLDVEERIKRSDSVKAELPDLVAKLYECFQP